MSSGKVQVNLHTAENIGSHIITVGVATTVEDTRWGMVIQFPSRAKVFIFSKPFRLAVGATQPPIQQIVRVKQLRHKADSSPHLVPKLRMSAAILELPHLPSWCVQGQQYYWHNVYMDVSAHNIVTLSSIFHQILSVLMWFLLVWPLAGFWYVSLCRCIRVSTHLYYSHTPLVPNHWSCFSGMNWTQCNTECTASIAD